MKTNASATTPNYGLSQWAEGDRILREDFNHDNDAIDTALHRQAQQTAAAIRAVEEAVPLVRLHSQTLTEDTGEINIDLSAVDMSQFAELELKLCGVIATQSNGYLYLTLNGDSGDESYRNDNTNVSTAAYIRVSGPSTNPASVIRVELYDNGESVIVDWRQRRLSSYSEGRGTWVTDALSAVHTITLTASKGELVSGATLSLYGWKK